MPADSGQRLGHYELSAQLGRGGMAEVWLGRASGPAGFARTVVIKRVLPHLRENPKFIRMFCDEARLSARLHHANIVQVFELGEVDGEYFLVMEHVAGRDLVSVLRAQLARNHKPLPVGLAASTIRDVCRALHHAHSLTDAEGRPLPVIHRDVTPSNVMLSFDGTVKLLDFGIAKALAETREFTQTGVIKGKVGYLAPERLDGLEADSRADQFSAAVILYELLVGKRLFQGKNDLQTKALVRDAPILPPSESNREVPPELDQLCLRALARRRDERFVDCGELAQRLDEVARRFGWGVNDTVALLRDLFPDAARAGQYTFDTVVDGRKHPRPRPWRSGIVWLSALALLLLLLAHRARRPVGHEVATPLPPGPPISQGATAAAREAVLPVRPAPSAPAGPRRRPALDPGRHAGRPKPTPHDVKGGEIADPF